LRLMIHEAIKSHLALTGARITKMNNPHLTMTEEELMIYRG
jgi:hypothetical protein